jgi:ribosomal protein S18 acetylase RimI-like enzyme
VLLGPDPYQVKIRMYDPMDRDNIITICYETGYMGESVRGHFSDKLLFARLFSLYYVDYEPQNCYVADYLGRAVGYLVGSQDTLKQKEQFRKKMYSKVLQRALLYTSWRHPKDFKRLLKWAKMSVSEYDKEHQYIIQEYPAHLHIDILPDYHRLGIGKRLMEQFLTHLKEHKVKGVHLGTSSRNENAIPFYLGLGFKILRTRPEGLWEEIPDTYSYTFGMKL